MNNGNIASFEALIRWQHPREGLLGADRVIPTAERSGLIVDIGDWVILQACRHAKLLVDAGYPYIGIRINASASQTRRGRLLQSVASAICSTGVSSRQIGIKVTGSTLQNERECIDTLDGLRDMACSCRLTISARASPA
jgi:EAL domain-containing protein (putative c-di-GMP-specific phosphodiesterase class I)